MHMCVHSYVHIHVMVRGQPQMYSILGFFLFNFFYFKVLKCLAHVYACALPACSACGGQKRVSENWSYR